MKRLPILALALASAVAASAQEEMLVPFRPLCKDGKLVGIEVIVPGAGRVQMQIPPDACAAEKPQKERPARSPRPSNST